MICLRYASSIRKELAQVTFSGVPKISRAQGQTQFWRPHQACSWQLDVKNELGIKGRRKLARALPSPAYLFLDPSEQQRWATATMKIVSLLLSLFAENNSGATSPVTEQK